MSLPKIKISQICKIPYLYAFVNLRFFYFWRMIPKSIQFYLCLIFIFLGIFGCRNSTKTPIQSSTSLEVNSLIEVGNDFNKEKNTDSAFVYFNKAKSIANSKTDYKQIAYSLLRMAEIQQNNDDNPGSENTATESIPFVKKSHNQNYTWDLYRILGENNFDTANYSTAIEFYQQALSLKTDKKRTLAIKNDIALAYIAQEKYQHAIQILESILKDEYIKKTPLQLAAALDHLGMSYSYINSSEKAYKLLYEGLALRLQLKNNKALGDSYLHLSQYYNTKNQASANKFASLSYESYTKVNNHNSRLKALALLIKTSSIEDLKKHSIAYTVLVDSVFEIRQNARNTFAKIKYDSKREKEENLRLKTQKAKNELQIERQKNRNIFSYIIIILSLILTLVIYYYLTSKGKKEKIEATYKSETRISKKLHDELANDIYHTMAFAETKNLSIIENKEQLVQNLSTIYSRTRDISKANNPVITNENYVFHLKEMISGFSNSNIHLILNGLDTISWHEIDKNKKSTVYRVLQELLVNMKKHSNATVLGINFKQSEKAVIINYTDNGKGIDLNKLAFKNGLNNVESRVIKIKGRINIESAPGKGFKVIFQFPV